MPSLRAGSFICPTGAVDLTTITARRVKPHITGFDKFLALVPRRRHAATPKPHRACR